MDLVLPYKPPDTHLVVGNVMPYLVNGLVRHVRAYYYPVRTACEVGNKRLIYRNIEPSAGCGPAGGRQPASPPAGASKPVAAASSVDRICESCETRTRSTPEGIALSLLLTLVYPVVRETRPRGVPQHPAEHPLR
jgi:hypothetical protein